MGQTCLKELSDWIWDWWWIGRCVPIHFCSLLVLTIICFSQIGCSYGRNNFQEGMHLPNRNRWKWVPCYRCWGRDIGLVSCLRGTFSSGFRMRSFCFGFWRGCSSWPQHGTHVDPIGADTWRMLRLCHAYQLYTWTFRSLLPNDTHVQAEPARSSWKTVSYLSHLHCPQQPPSPMAWSNLTYEFWEVVLVSYQTSYTLVPCISCCFS